VLPIDGVNDWFKKHQTAEDDLESLLSSEHVKFLAKKRPKSYLVYRNNETPCLSYFLDSDPRPDYGSNDTDTDKKTASKSYGFGLIAAKQ
jgi:hypothetical protein